MLLAALAVIPVHFYSVLPHQQQVLHEGLKVQLAQDHTLQLATSCRPTYINNPGLHLFIFFKGVDQLRRDKVVSTNK